MNWTNFILGGVVVVLMILCAIVVIPRVMDAFGGQSGEVATEPTEIPKVEIIIPTVEPPLLPEPESPAEESPVIDPLPEDGAETPQICSSLGFAGGFIFFGSVFGIRRRRKH
jgi:hypothetical protein